MAENIARLGVAALPEHGAQITVGGVREKTNEKKPSPSIVYTLERVIALKKRWGGA